MLTRLAIADLTKNDILLPISFLEDFKKENSKKVAMVYSNQSKTIHFFSLRNAAKSISSLCDYVEFKKSRGLPIMKPIN